MPISSISSRPPRVAWATPPWSTSSPAGKAGANTRPTPSPSKSSPSYGYATRRAVPSAGARHPFETYLAVARVGDLTPGLYRYLVKGAAVTFIWTAIPYRSEWRYSIIAEKHIALDAGHVCQNLYLASEAIGAGTCAIAAYDQASLDAILAVDGEDEFVLYVAPVGKRPR